MSDCIRSTFFRNDYYLISAYEFFIYLDHSFHVRNVQCFYMCLFSSGPCVTEVVVTGILEFEYMQTEDGKNTVLCKADPHEKVLSSCLETSLNMLGMCVPTI